MVFGRWSGKKATLFHFHYLNKTCGFQVIERKRGELRVIRHPISVENGKDYVPCNECYGFMRSKDFCKHTHNCSTIGCHITRKKGENLLKDPVLQNGDVLTEKALFLISSIQDLVAYLAEEDLLFRGFCNRQGCHVFYVNDKKNNQN